MRKSLILFLGFVLVAGFAFAEQTGKAVYDVNLPGYLANYNEDAEALLNEQDIFTHTHYVDSRRDPVKLFLDVVIYENPEESVEVIAGYERDVANDENTYKVGAKVYMWDLFKKSE